MSISIEKARDIVESVFTFDYVGDSMTKLRRDLSSSEAKDELIGQLIENSKKEASDTGPEDIQIIRQAAGEQVEEFIQSVQSTGSGCGGMKKLA